MKDLTAIRWLLSALLSDTRYFSNSFCSCRLGTAAGPLPSSFRIAHMPRKIRAPSAMLSFRSMTTARPWSPGIRRPMRPPISRVGREFPFGYDPPPNQACDFHRIRLSSMITATPIFNGPNSFGYLQLRDLCLSVFHTVSVRHVSDFTRSQTTMGSAMCSPFGSWNAIESLYSVPDSAFCHLTHSSLQAVRLSAGCSSNAIILEPLRK